MSKLEELINRLCPDGVEFSSVGKYFEIKTGKGITKQVSIENGQYPIISGGKDPMGYYDKKNREANITTISRVGANAGFVNFITTDFYLNDKCFSVIPFHQYENLFIAKFVFYYLKSIEPKIVELQSEGGVPTINTEKVSRLPIPILPILIQEEIVRILDTFTELETELEVELETRKKQYEYYRNHLLTFLSGDVEYRSLKYVSSYVKDRVSIKTITNENYVSVENLLQNKKGKTLAYYLPKEGSVIGFKSGDILIGNIRPYLRKIWLANMSGGTNGDVLCIRVNDNSKALSKYLYYILSSEDFFIYDTNNSRGGKMPRGDKDAVMNYKVPIPSLSIQDKIVSILDKFNTLCNDISQGLPREIELRRKQYEYYRDKLLTFKRKEVV